MRKVALMLTMLMLCAYAFAQTVTVRGSVKNNNGEVIPFATVTESGTRNAVTADANGSFQIKIKSGSKLVVTAANHEAITFTPTGAADESISLKTTGQLSEVVVTTALGIKRQPKELGYSVSKVSGGEVNQARVVNLQNGLTGKVSGLNIQTVNNGVFADTRITLRGIRSLTGNNQPLLVVDGVPMALGFINSISPNDIQEVNILKGNTGAALYGQDGTNGVIIVNTKKGTKGKARISVGSSFQAERISFLPDLQKEYGASETENLDGTPHYDFFTNNSFGPKFDGSMVPLGDPLEDGSQLMVRYANFNPAKKFFNTGTTFQNDISVSGGDDKSTYYFSVQDARIKGIVPKDENRRTSFRFNASRTFNRLTSSFNLGYIQGNYDVVNQGRGGWDNVYNTIIKTSPYIPITQFKDWRNNKFASADGWYNHFSYNPYMLIDIDRSTGRSDDFLGNLELSYKLLEGLAVTYRLGTTVSTVGFKNHLGAITVTPYTASTKGVQSTKASVGDGLSLGNRITSEVFVTGRRTFFNRLAADVLVGQSLIQRYTKAISTSGSDLVIPGLYNVSNRTGEPGVSEAFTKIRTVALFGKLSFGWDKFAFLELTLRNEWDSRLNIDKNSFMYPGASLSFLLTEVIPSLKNSRTLSYLKLRGAYAKSGNVNLGAYALESTFSGTSGSWPYGTLPGYTANGTINNPAIEPEFVHSSEVGLEIGFLKNRFLLEATAYKQNNKNQIIPVAVSRSTGYSNALVNAAAFTNKGIELDLKLTPLVKIGKDFNIDVKTNFTFSTNEVTQIYEGLDELNPGNNNYAIVGQPAFVLKLIDWARDSASGKVIINPVTGFPSLNSARTQMGNTLPKYIFGISPSFTWKSLALTVVADYRGGNFIYNDIGGDLGFNGVSALTAQYDRKPFVFPNSVILVNGKYVDNTSVLTQGGLGWWANSTFYNNETAFYTSANFWKIREVSLSYEIPQSILSKTKAIKTASITLTGRNLFTFLPKSNVYTDPEFSNTTGNYIGVNTTFNTPPTRIFGASLNLNF